MQTNDVTIGAHKRLLRLIHIPHPHIPRITILNHMCEAHIHANSKEHMKGQFNMISTRVYLLPFCHSARRSLARRQNRNLNVCIYLLYL